MLATLTVPDAVKKTPSLTLPTSTVGFAITPQWDDALAKIRGDKKKDFYLYNGWRPGSGSFVTDDDGVSVHQIARTHFKSRTARWFAWSGTYYNNFQGGTGDTRLFSSAHTFGGSHRRDPSLGETGFNYNNGDGVLFYPGTDRIYADENYNVDGPFASVRLKNWRRGLQDYEYLNWARLADAPSTNRIV